MLTFYESKSTHRTMGKFASPYPIFPEALVYLVPWRWVRHYNGTPMGGTGDGIPELHWRRWSYTILNFLPSCCHTIAVAAASCLLFEKPSRNPPNQTGFMAAGLGFEPKDGSSPSPVFKTGALNQALPSRQVARLSEPPDNLISGRGLSTTQVPMSMTTLYFGLSYEAVMPTTNSQSGDGAPFASHQLSSKRRQCDNLCPSFFILARAVSESVARMQRPDGCEPRHSIEPTTGSQHHLLRTS